MDRPEASTIQELWNDPWGFYYSPLNRPFFRVIQRCLEATWLLGASLLRYGLETALEGCSPGDVVQALTWQPLDGRAGGEGR